MKKQIQFIGLISNVDSSILNLKLDHGLEFIEMPTSEARDYFGAIEQVSIDRVAEIFMRFRCVNYDSKSIFFVSKLAEYYDNSSDSNILVNKYNEMASELMRQYLEPLFEKMRLFKEGSIFMTRHYFFSEIGQPSIRGHINLHIPYDPIYSITTSEVLKLESILNIIKLPFQRTYMKLAHENFEQSFRTENINLSYLSLMNGMESLYNDGPVDIGYKIRRYPAVLLGKDADEAETIYDNMKDLYEKRSKIIHAIKPFKVTKEDLFLLRDYLRGSIREMCSIDETKLKVLNLLTSTGFGERPWRDTE